MNVSTDPLLKEDLETLWGYSTPKTNELMTHISQWIKKYSLREIMEAVAYNTACRKASVSGLENAWALSNFFHSHNRLLPLVQMIWASLCEARSPEIDIKEYLGTPPLPSELNLEAFKKVYRENDIHKTFRWFVFLAREEKYRKDIFSFLASHVLSDEARMGYKMGYWVHTWQFCESLGWKNFYIYWFSVLHEIMLTPSKIESFLLVEAYVNDNAGQLLERVSQSREEGGVNEKIYLELKDTLFNDEKSQTLEKISAVLTGQKQSISTLFEFFKLISCDLMYEVPYSRWRVAVAAFHYVESVSDCVLLLEPKDQLKALFMAALFIKKMAILAKPFVKVSKELLTTLEEKEAPHFVLEYAIHRGKTAHALGALDYMITNNLFDQTQVELLAFLASQNNYSVMEGQDIAYANLCLKNYTRTSHPLRHMYVRSLVKLLAERPKDHTIYWALSNTQKIKLGYYSVTGDYGF